MIGQSKALLARKIACQLIHQISKLKRFLPDIELFEIKHAALISLSTLNYQPSTMILPDTASQPICLKTATTSVAFKSCLVIHPVR